jgi:hypothetical protein
MPTFGTWAYSVDRAATIRAYSAVEQGGADTCLCAGCRNFRLARADVFPTAFLALLEELGIDPRKDSEVTHITSVGPGLHEYGGWFHFIGALEETGDFPPVELDETFSTWMCQATAPRLSSLDGFPAVQLEFYAKSVPWLLPESELWVM